MCSLIINPTPTEPEDFDFDQLNVDFNFEDLEEAFGDFEFEDFDFEQLNNEDYE